MRELTQVLTAHATRDGAGVKIYRLAGRGLHQLLDPFLLLDEIKSGEATDYIGGFPEHPHRGFETISYMKVGRMRHRDHLGNEAVIGAGDVQWMTAGAGVLHSEMPEQEQGLLHGFQIWLNLPAAEKMKPAAYREIVSADIAEKRLPDGGKVRVIAGDVKINQDPLHGPLPEISTQPFFMDVTLTPDETVNLSFNEDSPALVYVYQGGTDEIDAHNLGIYRSGDTLSLKAGVLGAELLVLSGKPIKEPVVQYGPFVMNTEEEVLQAINDYKQGRFIS